MFIHVYKYDIPMTLILSKLQQLLTESIVVVIYPHITLQAEYFPPVLATCNVI